MIFYSNIYVLVFFFFLKDEHTALIYASMEGHKKVVEILLSAGADIHLESEVCDIDNFYDE